MSIDRRRRRHEPTAEPWWLELLWERGVRSAWLGLIIAIAGGIMIAAPLAAMPSRIDKSWWARGFQSPDMLQVSAILLAGCVPLLIGLWVRRSNAPVADLRLDQSHDLPISSMRNTQLALAAALGLMLTGAIGVSVVWVGLQRGVPPAEVLLPQDATTEHVIGQVRGKPVKVMLPRRASVEISGEIDAPVVDLTLSRPKEEGVEPQQLTIGEFVEVDDTRLTFVGLADDPNNLRAVITGTSGQSIQALASKGQEFKVSLDGPTYTVIDLSLNYIGAMGPAVQVEPDNDEPPFWLFLRQPTGELKDPFTHGLRLDRIETSTAAAFTFGPVVPFEPLVTFSVIFVLGLGLLLGVPEQRPANRRRRVGLASLNEAGALAESFALSTMSDADLASEEE